MADTFAKAKLQLLNRVMHDWMLTPAARLVFYEILDHTNRVSGDAWPSEQRIADRLGIEERTVRRALHGFKTRGKPATADKPAKPDRVNLGLVQRGYIIVEIDGRSNTYRPVFDQPPTGGTPDKMSGAQGGAQDPPTPDKNAGNTGHFVHGTPDKNHPLSFLREPTQENLLKNTTNSVSILSRAREGSPSRQDDPLASKPDDGGIHLMLIEELGSDIVEALHAIDDGRPLKLLTTQRRIRHLTPIETAHARSLAAGELRLRGGLP